MARVGKLEAIDNQIKKKQEKLFELKEKSDAQAKEIEELLNQKKEVHEYSCAAEPLVRFY